VERSRVQILVVVARIQVRILKAEEGKVSEVTVFGFGLVGPKVYIGALNRAQHTEREHG